MDSKYLQTTAKTSESTISYKFKVLMDTSGNLTLKVSDNFNDASDEMNPNQQTFSVETPLSLVVREQIAHGFVHSISLIGLIKFLIHTIFVKRS